MSIEKTGSRTDELHTRADLPGTDLAGTGTPGDERSPEKPRPRFRQAITTGAARVREAAPARARQAGGAVRQRKAPTAGILALAGGVIAALVLRRRAAQAKAAPARRWVPARFQR
ncbi:hypothetical protein [Actinoplanes sp. M2I2]|uniref:hypothetical protein n=1 Tax=Actinoplanes sp. M2I2 TaxID=1734444 RepID=UPI0020222F4B|nr:hypothetical protein [Actinoplanes sp. M2I2]